MVKHGSLLFELPYKVVVLLVEASRAINAFKDTVEVGAKREVGTTAQKTDHFKYFRAVAYSIVVAGKFCSPCVKTLNDSQRLINSKFSSRNFTCMGT